MHAMDINQEYVLIQFNVTQSKLPAFIFRNKGEYRET